jgi:hypothetical protein
VPQADFSSDVLQHATGLYVVPLERCGWSDWGTPERVLESLRNHFHFHVTTQKHDAAHLSAALERLQAAALLG